MRGGIPAAERVPPLAWVTGVVVSAVVGLLVIHALLSFVRTRSYTPFVVYRVLAGMGVLLWVLAGH